MEERKWLSKQPLAFTWLWTKIGVGVWLGAGDSLYMVVDSLLDFCARLSAEIGDWGWAGCFLHSVHILSTVW